MERNPNHGKCPEVEKYEDLGWVNEWYDDKEHPSNVRTKQCRELGHKKRELDNSLYLFRGTDRITICDECKTIYHTDSSD